MKRYILALAIAINALLYAEGQPLTSHRFEQRSFSLGGGYTNMLDTYLSPLRYDGPHVALLGESLTQTSASSGQWFSQSLFSLHGDYTTPNSRNGLTVGGMADYSYTYFYKVSLKNKRLSLYAGPQGQLRIGGIYNLRNSNTPAQLKLGINLAASTMANYAFTLWRTPMNVCLQASVPLLGAAFAPDYGQSYYEIFYLGQSEGCMHLTSLHNNLSLRINASYDIELKPCTLRLTLANDLYQWALGNQHYRLFTHSLMIGYVKNLYHVMHNDNVKQYIPY